MGFTIADMNNYMENLFNKIRDIVIYVDPLVLKMIYIYLIIKYVVLNISLYFILIKENKKAWHAFVPLLNIYEYCKIVHIPFIIFFIPVLNIFLIVLSPYKLCKQYKYGSLMCTLSVLVPELFYIMIAFNNRTNKDHHRNENFIRTLTELDQLDEKMGKENKIDVKKESKFALFRFIKRFKDKYNYPDWKQIKKYKNTIEEKISTIENSVKQNPSYDEYVLDIDEIQINENRQKYVFEEEVQEAIDEDINTVEALEEEKKDESIKSLDEINKIEKEQVQNEKKSTNVDENDYKDYKGVQKTDAAIAFGDKQQDEELAKQKNDMKVNKHVCPKCGASLVGATDYCPGCNTPIDELFPEEKLIEEL